MSAKFSGLTADAATYLVFGATEDGWFTTGKTGKDLNELLGEVLTLPAYYLAVAAVEEIKQARGNNKLTKIKQNLANLRAAKEEAVAEKNLQDGQMLNRQDIEEYVTEWPESAVARPTKSGSSVNRPTPRHPSISGTTAPAQGSSPDFRIQDSGFRIQDSGFRIQDSGFRIQDSGFRMIANRKKPPPSQGY